ncbi:MAG: hypothetical protein IJQ28_07625, partial [Clostridia bacterium]|nr:hypothetical protein [Clostridia bacterium]
MYPDLEVTEVSTSVNSTTLAPGQNIVLYATVKNSGKGKAVVPTRTSFYANSRYIGSVEAGALAAGDSTLVSLVWKDPSISVTTITAVADAGEILTESSETNNSGLMILETPLKVSTSRIEISEMTTTGASKYGDQASTVITVVNSGERSIDDTFTVALYAGSNRVGTALCGPLAAGEKARVTIDWTAEISGN